MGALISSLAVASDAHADLVPTDDRGLIAGDALIKAYDGPLPGYFARPYGIGPYPIVLVCEESYGMTDHIKDVCRRLAKSGYAAVTVEIYGRFVELVKLQEKSAFIENIIPRTADGQMLSDLDAAVAYAGQHGGDLSRIAVTGFGRGGRNTWIYNAVNPRLRAAVAWYGPVGGVTSPLQPYTPLDVAGRLNAPLLGLYAGDDPSIAVADVQLAVTLARSSGRSAELVIYPDAPHSFFADDHPSYRPDAANDAWLRMIDWFRRNGV